MKVTFEGNEKIINKYLDNFFFIISLIIFFFFARQKVGLGHISWLCLPPIYVLTITNLRLHSKHRISTLPVFLLGFIWL